MTDDPRTGGRRPLDDHDRAWAEEIAERASTKAADKAVNQVMWKLGVDPNDLDSVKAFRSGQDFIETIDREKFRANMAFVTELRETKTSIFRSFIEKAGTMLAMVAAGALSALFWGQHK